MAVKKGLLCGQKKRIDVKINIPEVFGILTNDEQQQKYVV